MDEAIDKLRYTHEACIDIVIANPGISQGALARMFGYTEPWMSRVMSSSAFKARLAERRAELVDPRLLASIEEKLEELTFLSMGVVQEKLEAGRNAQLAMDVLQLTTRSLGYGAARAAGPAVQINQQFVVQAPAKAQNGAEWAAQYAPAGLEPLGEVAPMAEPPRGEVTPAGAPRHATDDLLDSI